MACNRGRDTALSESLSGLLIVILIIICAGLIGVQLFGLLAIPRESMHFTPVTDFPKIDGKDTLRIHHGGGDTAVLAGPGASSARYHLSLFIETQDGLYEVIADESLKDPVFSPGDSLVVFRAPDSYRFTDSPEVIVPAGNIPTGPFSLKIVDETHNVPVASLGENGWESHDIPVATPTVLSPTPVQTLLPTPEQSLETPVPTELPTTQPPVVVVTGTPKVTPVQTKAKTYPVYLDTGRSGVLSEGGYLRFRTAGQYSYIRIGTSSISLSSGDEVQLTLGSPGNGKIYMTGAMINAFGFDDVLVLINGELIGRGSIEDIYINGYTGLSSTLSLWVPSQSAETSFRFNNVQVFSGVTNTPITINGLVPGGTNGVLNLDLRATRTYLDGGARDYTLS